MQIKTPFRSHLTAVGIAVIKKTTSNSGLDVNEREPIGTAGGLGTSQVTIWKSVWSFLRRHKIGPPYDLIIYCSLVFTQKTPVHIGQRH